MPLPLNHPAHNAYFPFRAQLKLLVFNHTKDENAVKSLLLRRAFWKQFITHQRTHCYIVIV